MKRNVGGVDQIFRVAVGLALMALAVTGRVGTWGWLGAVLVATGVFGFCGAYTLFGFSTCPLKPQTPVADESARKSDAA